MFIGHGGPGFGILFGVVWFLGVVLVALVCIGLVVLLVRFLIVATRAAQIYIEQHGGAPTGGMPRRYATYTPMPDGPAAAPASDPAPAPAPPHPEPTPDPSPEDVAPPVAPPPSAPKRAPRTRKSPGAPE